MSGAVRHLVLVIALSILTAASSVRADESFKHTPPFKSTAQSQVTLTFAAGQTRRARVLVAGRNGYRLFEMQRNGNLFESTVDFADLSLLRYRFQYENLDGKILESEQYEIRQSSDAQLEGVHRELKKDSARLKAKIAQSEAKLFSLQSVKPEDLAQNKNSELAQALLLVGEREKELAQLREQKK